MSAQGYVTVVQVGYDDNNTCLGLYGCQCSPSGSCLQSASVTTCNNLPVCTVDITMPVLSGCPNNTLANFVEVQFECIFAFMESTALQHPSTTNIGLYEPLHVLVLVVYYC